MSAQLKLVQYVVVRRDLLDSLKWPFGAVITQACHACTAIVHMTYNDEQTQMYLADLDNMHKVVLEASGQEQIENLAQKLEENNIAFKLWIEQPENYPTCLAIKPYPKDDVHKYVKKFKLFK